MGWTKRQFVIEAFSEIGYAGYDFDLLPEQLETGLRRLDSLMARWNGKGIQLGYPLPSSQESSDLDTITNIPDWANEAVYTNLAIAIAPIVGKTVSIDTKVNAKEGRNVIYSRTLVTHEQVLPTSMPKGAGNKPWREEGNFITEETNNEITPPLPSLEFKP